MHPATTGKTLVHNLWEAIRLGDRQKQGASFSPAFQINHADGTNGGRAEELLMPVAVKRFTLSNLHVTHAPGLLVARYRANVVVLKNGKELRAPPGNRITTFVWNGAAWHVVSTVDF